MRKLRMTPRRRAFDIWHDLRRRCRYVISESLKGHLHTLIEKRVCSLCGYPIHLDKRDMHLSPTVDRIDSAGRYTVKNTQVVHFECNRIKGELPERLVKPHIQRIMAKAYGFLSAGKATRPRRRPVKAGRA